LIRELPIIPLQHLDQLWFQVAGTRCNLTCHHCFISCSPKNHSFGFLSLDEVLSRLDEAQALGVKEYYFTGGEPFLNPQLVEMLEATLKIGPATVLTNGTVLRQSWLERLIDADRQSRYSLEFRVSIDGFSAETNDPIRGVGTFERAMDGVSKLVASGFLPLITAARTWDESADLEYIDAFIRSLRAIGYDRPRLKLLPTLKLGAESQRTSGYQESERVDAQMLAGFDRSQLICDHSRIVTDRGVHVCPILIESSDSWLGQTLHESLSPFPIIHGACFTCFQFGAICSNPSSGLKTGAFKSGRIREQETD
jgi:AdoMet-dependent heme synthase